MPAPAPNPLRRKLLAEALQLSRYLLTSGKEIEAEILDKRQERLRQIRETLKEFAHPICRDRISLNNIPLAVRQIFVTATLMVTRYHQLGGSSWQGTFSSPTLSQYHPDPIPEVLRSPEAIITLCQGFNLSDTTVKELTTLLDKVDQQIDQQKQIIQAILTDTFGTSDSDKLSLSSEAILSLFQYLFGDIPIPGMAIDCIYTEMQIYFCLNYRDGQLYDHNNSNLLETISQEERSQIEQFWQSLSQFSFEQFQRFPIFGACDPSQINSQWCGAIAQRLGLSPTQILQTLSRSISIIPTSKAEAFLVHDIWGHNWQLMLTQFESDYAILTTCDEPLRAGETAYTAYGPLTCGEVFELEEEQVKINLEKALLFFHGEVQQRLGLLFTHLIGEMVADVAEFKFIWSNPEATDDLLSSSLFKTEPTKLDLSLHDIDFLFLRVLQPLLEVKLSVVEDSTLEQDLLTQWQAKGKPVNSLELRTSLKQAVAHLYQIFLEEYNATYLPTMIGEEGIFTKMVSNLLYLQNATNSLYTDLSSEKDPTLPFRDLLIVFIACYCSSDSYAEFWDIDNVLASYFLPCWQQLVGWIN